MSLHTALVHTAIGSDGVASLLGTLAQSSAAIVAIVGGFLVSRLVALSSEREGLRRQLWRTEDQLRHVTVSYAEAHAYRLANSQRDFEGWVLDDIVSANPVDLDADDLLEQIPRGSSREEMAPHLEHLIARVNLAKQAIGQRLYPNDTRPLRLEDLEERGLEVPNDDADIYERVVRVVSAGLPARDPLGFAYDIPIIQSPVVLSTDLRRLDESIRDEQELGARQRLLETDLERLATELALAGKPVGVIPAIGILAAVALLGIVVPVVVLATDPTKLPGWQLWGLVALFVLGLLAVLGYILWYARTFNDLADTRPAADTRESV